MPNFLYKGIDYDYIVKSSDLLTVEVLFDSNGGTVFIRRNGEWTVESGYEYLPANSSISEIGRLIEEEL